MIADVAARPSISVEAPAPETGNISQRERAEQLIAAGATDEAQTILVALEQTGRNDSQIQFLLGLISFSKKDYDDAIRRYRSIIASEPGAVRVRLELGRTYFQKGDFRNAERQFQFARSGKLPPAVLKNIDAYLTNIRRNRTFEIGVSFAIAPDTNINAGPSINDVLLFGLPFPLSPDAKANSGVGIAVAGRINWAPRLSNALRWDVGVAADARRYFQSNFNDTAIAAFSGPHLVLDRIDARINARVGRRWYGGERYTDSIGGNVDLAYYFSGRTGIFSSLTVSQLAYARIPVQNGVVREFGFGAFHAITPSSVGRVSVTIGRQGAKQPALANRILGGTATYLRETGGGFTLTLLGQYRNVRYDARLPAFRDARNDDQLVLQVSVLNRRLVVKGFTPTVSFTQTMNNSNVPLFQFQRSQFEFGVSRLF